MFFLFVIAKIAFVLSQTDTGAANDTVRAATHLGVTRNPLTLQQGEQLFVLSYAANCSTVYKSFLVPCHVACTEIGETDARIDTKIVTTRSDYSQDENVQIHGEAGCDYAIFKAKASYSEESEKIFKKCVEESQTFAQASISMRLYELAASSLTMTLSDNFVAHIAQCVAALDAGDMMHYAYWLSELTTKYPAAYVKRVVVGGTLLQKMEVDDYYTQTTNIDIFNRSVAASASFVGFSVGGDYMYGLTQEQVDTFTSHRTWTETSAVGGSYLVTDTLPQWQQRVLTDPAPTNFYLADTKDCIVPPLLPQFKAERVWRIQRDYAQMQQAYRDENTHFGCTQRNATNFRLAANVDDGSCYFVNSTSTAFGGFYAEKTWLIPGSGGMWSQPMCGANPVTTGCNCELGGYNVPHFYTAQYNDPDPGMTSYSMCFASDYRSSTLFGGTFSVSSPNPLTGHRDCPPTYDSVKQWSWTADPTYFCIGSANGSSTPNYAYGGSFILLLDGTTCGAPNPVTGDCTCPGNAPLPANAAQEHAIVVFCVGPPVYQKEDAGDQIALRAMPQLLLAFNQTFTEPRVSELPLATETHGKSRLTSFDIALMYGLLLVGVFLVCICGFCVSKLVFRAKNAENGYERLA